jgi:hypothetical protein
LQGLLAEASKWQCGGRCIKIRPAERIAEARSLSVCPSLVVMTSCNKDSSHLILFGAKKSCRETDMKATREEEKSSYLLLAPELDGDEWSASRSARSLTPWQLRLFSRNTLRVVE